MFSIFVFQEMVVTETGRNGTQNVGVSFFPAVGLRNSGALVLWNSGTLKPRVCPGEARPLASACDLLESRCADGRLDFARSLSRPKKAAFKVVSKAATTKNGQGGGGWGDRPSGWRGGEPLERETREESHESRSH